MSIPDLIIFRDSEDSKQKSGSLTTLPGALEVLDFVVCTNQNLHFFDVAPYHH